VDDLRQAKTRLLGLLRRLGYNSSGKTHCTEAHKRYLRELHLPFPAHRVILEKLLGQVDQLAERIARLETQMELLYRDWQRKPVVDAVIALKGFRQACATADRRRKVDAGRRQELEFILQHGPGQRLVSMRLFCIGWYPSHHALGVLALPGPSSGGDLAQIETMLSRVLLLEAANLHDDRIGFLFSSRAHSRLR